MREAEGTTATVTDMGHRPRAGALRTAQVTGNFGLPWAVRCRIAGRIGARDAEGRLVGRTRLLRGVLEVDRRAMPEDLRRACADRSARRVK